jgi:DNA-binding SARP family transcriptional activator
MVDMNQQMVKPDGNTTDMLLRISTFGPLTIEWVGQPLPFPVERLSGRGAAPALALLRALISQPHRFALRDWLMEQFWPDSAHSRAEERLDDVASGLRSLLRPPGSQAKILHYVYGIKGSGSGYRLENYPVIWVDADAFCWCVEQAARLDRFGEPSLSYWEQAYQLAARGTFLLEEPYSDWAAARRASLQGQYRQCVHRLTALLRQAGAREEAVLRLRTYWHAHPTDEDALRPLLELLGEQERYQEAEDYFAQAREALSQEGKAFDDRTTDVIEYLRTKQIQRLSKVTSQHQRFSSAPYINLSLTSTRAISPVESIQAFSSTTLRYNRKDKDVLDTSMQALQSFAQIQDTKKREMKRRDLLQALSAAGAILLLPVSEVDWERLDDAIEKPSHIDDAVVKDLKAINDSYWSLYLAASSKFSVLDGALGQLKTLFQFLRNPHHPSVHQQLCMLCSDLAQLTGEIFFDSNDSDTAQSCYLFAASAAKEVRAYDLWSTALIRHSFLPLYQEYYADALLLLTEAEKLAKRGDHLLPTRFWAAAVKAEAASGIHQFSVCQDALDLAQRVAEINAPNLAWIRFDGSRLPALRGACYVRLQRPDLAEPALKDALRQDPFRKPSRRRGMVLTDLAASAFLYGDIEQGCAHLHEAIDIVLQGSSGFLREGIFKLRVQLEPYAQAEAVKQLDQHLGQTQLLA